MKKFFIGFAVLIIFFIFGAASASALDWTLTSPGGNITAHINLAETGTTERVITWRAELDGREVLHPSPVGIYTAYADFRNTLYYVSDSRTAIDETYPMVSGKFSTYINKANELTIRVSRASGSNTRYINYIFRAYDDGVAVRYHIEGTGTTTNNNTNFESTGLQLLATDNINVMPYQRSYEGSYSEFTGFSGMTNTNGYNMPVLVRTALGDHLMFTEADLNARYVGATLRRPSDAAGVMQIRPNNEQGSTNVNIALPFTSPWRVAVIGTLADINETMMIENLSEPCKIEDTSWIKPGITSWAWLTRSSFPQSSKQTWIDQIDFAAEIGWKYVLMDDGWQPNAWTSTAPINVYYDWFDDVIEYASQKGVGLLAWVHQSRLNTPAKRELLKEWSAKGIVGIKTDFFDSEAQSMLQVYDDITKAAADAKLIVNYHGANKPTGERRAWPNLLAKEGVLGAEQSSTSAAQDCILPFTRNAVGPMDFTPLQDPWFSASNYTTAHNTALAITVECGIQCLADYPNAYLNSPAREFFQYMPCAWDETVCIGAQIRQLYAVARRSGDTWYVGVVNNAARTENIKLDFLGEGSYYAMVIREGATRNSLNVEIIEVTKDSTVSFQMGASSGGAMKITKTLPIGLLERMIIRANEELRINAQQIADFVAVSQAADVLKSEIAIAEVVRDNPTSLAAVEAARTRLSNAIDVFLKAIKDANTAELLPPWYNKYPLYDYFKYNSPYSLSIFTEQGDFYDVSPSNRATKEMKNLHLIDLANTTGQIEITTELTFTPSGNYHTAGIIFYVDDYNFYSVMRRFHSGGSPNQCFMTHNRVGNGSTAATEVRNSFAATSAKCYLRIVKNGSTVSAYFRENENEAWRSTTSYTNSAIANATQLSVGVFASKGYGMAAPVIPATFENFRINGEIIPFTSDFVSSVPDISVRTPVGVAPVLPATVPVVFTNGTRNLAVVWDAVTPDKYASVGTFGVRGVVTELGRYVTVNVTVFGTSVEIVPGDYKADAFYTIVAEGRPLEYMAILALYDVGGRLAEMVTKTGSLQSGEWIAETLSMDQGRGYTVKAFVWELPIYVPLIPAEVHIEPLYPDKSGLVAVSSANTLVASADFDYYTRLSADAFIAVLDRAKAVNLDDDATKSMINTAMENLEAARGALVSRIVKLTPGATGSYYGTAGTWGSGRTFDMIFDGDISTFYDAASGNNNYAGIDLGPGNEAYIHYFRLYPRPDDMANRINSSTIRGSMTVSGGGTGGTQLASITGVSAINWYTFNSSVRNTAYRYIWIQCSNNSFGNLSELEFYGIRPGADLSLLSDRIAYADALTASDYTAGSWADLQAVLTPAKALTTASTQANVDSAANNLKTAIAQLIPA